MPFVSFRQEKIYYETYGSGRAVVLLHGFLGSSATWNKMSTALSKKYRVVVIDLPGHGQSDCFGYVHTMSMMAEAVKAVLNHLLLRKYVLIGHSMGGYVCLAFGEKYMDNLRGIMLFHSTPMADSEEKISTRKKSIKVIKRNYNKYLEEALRKLYYPPNLKSKPGLLVKAKTIAEMASVQGVIAAMEGMILRKNTEVVLEFCPAPIASIAGRYDELLPLDSHYVDLPKKVHKNILESSAHMGFDEEPVKALTYIKSFLKVCFAKLN